MDEWKVPERTRETKILDRLIGRDKEKSRDLDWEARVNDLEFIFTNLDGAMNTLQRSYEKLEQKINEISDHVNTYLSCIHTIQTALFTVRRWKDEHDEQLEGIRSYITKKWGYKFQNESDETPF